MAPNITFPYRPTAILNATTNTTTRFYTTKWNFPAIAGLNIFISLILMNGSTLVMFLKEPKLRTPFGIYLICLMTVNMIYALLDTPLDIINNLYPVWVLGPAWCGVYIYAVHVMAAAIIHTHLLITINRIWAMFFSISYRRVHSHKVAGLSCLGMLVYVHLILLPGFVLDMMAHHPPIKPHGCVFNADSVVGVVMWFITFFGPETLILAAFPVVWYKRNQRQRALPRRQSRAAVTVGENDGRSGTKLTAVVPSHADNTTSMAHRENKRTMKSGSHGFAVLSLLTLSIFICWTPGFLMFASTAGGHVDFPTVIRAYPFTVALSAFQAVMDPILFIIAMKDLTLVIPQANMSYDLYYKTNLRTLFAHA